MKDKSPPILSAEGYRQAIASDKEDEIRQFVWLPDDRAGNANTEVQYQPEEVFLSHRGPDTKYNLVLPLAGVLKELYGVTCFVDLLPTNIESRAQTENKVDILRQSLWSCSVVLIFLSPRFHESKWCLRELYTAWYRRAQHPASVKVHIVFCGISPEDCKMMPEYEGLNLGKGFGSGLKTQGGLVGWVVPEIAEQQLGVEILHPTAIKLIFGDRVQLRNADEVKTKWKKHSLVIRRTRLIRRAVCAAVFLFVCGLLVGLGVVFGVPEEPTPTVAPTVSPVPTSAPTVVSVTWNDVWTRVAPPDTSLFGVRLDVSDDASVLLVGSMGRAFCFRRSNTSSYTFWQEEMPYGTGRRFGMGLAISSSGNYAALSDPHRVSDSSYTGTLQVLYYTGASWQLLGYPKKLQYGPTDVDEFLHGDYLSIARRAGDIVAIGDLDNGIVQSIYLNESDWMQRPSLALERSDFGWAVDLNEWGTVLAVGARDARAGHPGLVVVYEWNETKWVPRGEPIRGDSNNRFGHAVKLSADGSVLAASANFNFDGGRYGGHVRVFEWDGIQWNQRGNDIVGYRSEGDLELGKSLAINSDGSRIAIGSPYWKGRGRVVLYSWTGWQWVQRGEAIESSQTSSGEFGKSVALSADGNFLLVGNPYSNESTGYVKLFQANLMGTESAPRVQPPEEIISLWNTTFGSSNITTAPHTMSPSECPSTGPSTLIHEEENATRARDIAAFVRSIWSLPYPGNSSLYERALHWLIHTDPAKIGPTNTLQLLQRFALVSWCLQWMDSSVTGTYGWMTASHECDWEGIQCQTAEDGRFISKIVKRGDRMVGSVPEVLGLLSNLTDLDLSLNLLVGTVPHLTSLKWISLSFNRLTGNVPSSLSDLTVMGLSHNFLTGTLPSKLGLMSALVFLDLANNQLTGSVPSELTNLRSLASISLYGNQLSGSTPFCEFESTHSRGVSIIADCDSLHCPCCTGCCPSSYYRIPMFAGCGEYSSIASHHAHNKVEARVHHTANGWN